MRPLALLVLLLFAPLASPAAAQTDLPRGQVVDKVVTQVDPAQSYALYVPTTYRPDRKWPILYAFDSRYRGTLVAERFRAGAEKYGYLVASSHNSASDGPPGPNVTALRAIWSDTHARFSIDDRRVYAAGFSGTVRFACSMALAAPGTIEGIIGAGAGFPFETKPTKETPFVFFGTAGERDFNYYEMVDLDEQMGALGLHHRIEIFPGAHEWMPEDLATRALGWMEIQAMRKGLREKDPKLIAELWSADLERARAMESAGDLVEAHRLYAGLASDFAGLHEGAAEVATKASGIAASEAYKKERKAWQERNERDKQYIAAAPRALSLPDLPLALNQLRIKELKKQAESSDKQENLSARRLLNTVLVQTSFYLPEMFTSQGQHERAIFALSIATEIAPDNGENWYRLAAAHARKGAKKRALENLSKAVEKGWADLSRLEGEAAFAPLRQDKVYQELVAEIAEIGKKKPAEAGTGS